MSGTPFALLFGQHQICTSDLKGECIKRVPSPSIVLLEVAAMVLIFKSEKSVRLHHKPCCTQPLFFFIFHRFSYPSSMDGISFMKNG